MDLVKLYNDPKFGLVGIDAFHKKLEERGINVSKDVIRMALADQDSYTLNKPVRKKFAGRRVVAFEVFEQLQMDLVFMDTPTGAPASKNKGYKYILTAIDVLSKYAWAIPLKDKSARSTVNAIKEIIEFSKPQKIQVDKGTEFYNSQVKTLLKNNDVLLFSTYSDKKASVVERFNRTLKQRMKKLFDSHNTDNYIDYLEDLVFNYNNTTHSTIKMKPVDAIKPENYDQLLTNFYRRSVKRAKPRFALGDFVRIYKWKSKFAKELAGNWTVEVFKIRKINYTQPVTYQLEDLMGEEITGGFYENELQKVSENMTKRGRIEKILKRRTKDGVKQIFVKWEGYPEKFNTWINEENIQ
jgi:hypothetical protein